MHQTRVQHLALAHVPKEKLHGTKEEEEKLQGTKEKLMGTKEKLQGMKGKHGGTKKKLQGQKRIFPDDRLAEKLQIPKETTKFERETEKERGWVGLKGKRMN